MAENVLNLNRSDFNAAIRELADQGMDTSFLRQKYREQNSPFSGLLDYANRQQQRIEDAGRRPIMGGLLSKPVDATGMDAITQAEFEPAAFISGLLSGGAQAVDAPAAAMRGDLTRDEAEQAAVDTAGMMLGGGIAGAGRSAMRFDPNTTRMFLGKSASNADLEALQKARELSARRRSPEEIWNETGWFKGADGEWRFEIADDRAVLRQAASDALNYGGEGYGTNYSGGILHQPLLGGSFRGQEYAPAYDFMADMDFRQRPRVAGSYDRDTAGIEVYAPSAQEGLPVTLHELQHAIQAKEGFAPGSNPEFEMGLLLEAQNAKINDTFAKINQKQQELGLHGYRPKHPDIDPLYAEYDQLMEARGSIPRDEAYQQYIRTAGEVEANNVMNRRAMTPAERAATPPWLTQDFPYEEQIVRKGSGSRTQGLLGGAR